LGFLIVWWLSGLFSGLGFSFFKRQKLKATANIDYRVPRRKTIITEAEAVILAHPSDLHAVLITLAYKNGKKIELNQIMGDTPELDVLEKKEEEAEDDGITAGDRSPGGSGFPCGSDLRGKQPGRGEC
jgi:hypothetical protein